MTVHEFLTVFTVGLIAGGAGFAGYWLATHIHAVTASAAAMQAAANPAPGAPTAKG